MELFPTSPATLNLKLKFCAKAIFPLLLILPSEYVWGFTKLHWEGTYLEPTSRKVGQNAAPDFRFVGVDLMGQEINQFFTEILASGIFVYIRG